MILPKKCPKCHTNLVNDLVMTGGQFVKSCEKRTGHKFFIRGLLADNYILSMRYIVNNTLNTNKPTIIYWDFLDKKLIINPYILIKGRSVGATTMGVQGYQSYSKESMLEIPWFEPDISNFPKLLEKIKTYIVFV